MAKKIIGVLLISALLVGFLIFFRQCGKQSEISQSDDNRISVSIYPIKGLVDEITGGMITVDVLVPPGSSPETYEPTPQQFISLNNSSAVFVTGLMDFESALFGRISEGSPAILSSVSKGVDLLDGECNHDHSEHSHGEQLSGHHHGIDPHIWTSPRRLKQMALNIYETLSEIYPDSSQYEVNYQNLVRKIDELDSNLHQKITDSDIKYFLIYHPALTYYAEDYSIEQIALEDHGKEPSVERLRRIVDMARKDGIDKVFYQKEFSRSTVETVAADIGAQIYEIDPLAEDVLNNLIYITDLITGE